MRKWVIIAVVVTLTLIVALVASAFAIFSMVAGMMDRSGSHVCGLALVRRSPVALAMLGSPIGQTGYAGGSTSSDNGEDHERITFWVKGPKGSAFVSSTGDRSPLASHLVVVVGRDQRSATIYAGPFDCPELHATTK